VRTNLIENGVDPIMLVARGYEPSQPVASNDTEEGKFSNRRIAFTVLSASEGARVNGLAAIAEATPAATSATPVNVWALAGTMAGQRGGIRRKTHGHQ